MNNWNYRIKTIAVPDYDDEGRKTGEYITLEIVGIEKMKVFVQAFEGGSYSEEKLYFICFEKQIGKPKRLHVICAETEGEIEILRYEKNENDEFRHSSKRGKTKGRTENRGDNNSKHSETDREN
jgi:hypothetical protein